jgi:hypothetical protein
MGSMHHAGLGVKSVVAMRHPPDGVAGIERDWPRSRYAGAAGRVTSKLAPRPGPSLWAVIVP